MDTCQGKSQGPTIAANTITTTHHTVRRIRPRGLRSLLARHDSPLRNQTRTPGPEFGLCLPLAEPPERPTIVATHLHDFYKPTSKAAITAALARTDDGEPDATRNLRPYRLYPARDQPVRRPTGRRCNDVRTIWPMVRTFGSSDFSLPRRFVSRRASMLRP